MAARKKAWVTALLAKRTRIEGALGVPLGEMLGCGHFGCVFQSSRGLVVKLSIDPTEGPIWAKIRGLIEEERYGDLGFPEVTSITRLTPDIPYGGRKKKVWAILRGEITPVFDLSKWGLRFTPFTREELGFDAHTEYWGGSMAAYGPAAEDFGKAIEGLAKYRALATDWHNKRRVRTGYDSDAELEAKIERTLSYYFSGAKAGGLGESLSMLASNRVYLRDVHIGNIGWHVAAAGDGDDWTRLVIFDPGHTPTDEVGGIATALVENHATGD